MSDIFRKEYREISESEKSSIENIKERAEALYELLNAFPTNRESALSVTKLEEAVMWAIKSITRQ